MAVVVIKVRDTELDSNPEGKHFRSFRAHCLWKKGCVCVSGEKLPHSFKGKTLKEVNWFLADRRAGQGREPANIWGHGSDLLVPLV